MYPTPAGEAFQQNGVWYQDYNVMDESTGQVETKRFMHNGTDWVPAPTAQTRIDITKKIPDTPGGIDLKKHVINLEKCIVDLNKNKGFSLDTHRAKVAVIIDVSYSMNTIIKNGDVQRLMNRLAPLALRFDDNGELDVWIFSNDCDRMEGMTIYNFEDYVKQCILGSRSRALWGGTNYAPAIQDTIQKYMREDPDDCPVFVVYVTDGSNSDKRATNDAIIQSSKTNIFYQFVGIGDAMFPYLEKLDDLPGRAVDNTGFIKAADINRMSDDELYSKLLDQYVDWLRVKGFR